MCRMLKTLRLLHSHSSISCLVATSTTTTLSVVLLFLTDWRRNGRSPASIPAAVAGLAEWPNSPRSLPLLVETEEASYLVGSGTVFSSERSEEKTFLAASVGGINGDGHLFWDCTHPPFAHVWESPEFAEIVMCDKSRSSRCLLWHGWLPALGACQVSYWVCSWCLFALKFWFVMEALALALSHHPDQWSDGVRFPMRLLVFVVLGLVGLPRLLEVFGVVECGVTWVLLWIIVDCTEQCLDPCNLPSVQKFGV